ncbi:MAG: hypothetical protein Q9207_003158 [Kuettlingeria erythrocarpa]
MLNGERRVRAKPGACAADRIQFIDLYPAAADPQQTDDLSLRRLFCNFLECCLLVVIARAGDSKKDQLQYYSELRNTMNRFRASITAQLSRLEGGAKRDLLRKYACLVAFDFEAAAQLGMWTSFGGLVEQIVNKVWQPGNGDVDRLARWIRCLFSLALSSSVEMAENIVDQVISIAESAKEKPASYPAEELEWIATTTFNRAIDFYCASQDDASRRWAEKAMSLANLGNDDGHLYKLLENKYLGLAWGG